VTTASRAGLDGRVALVTGASRGIGRATALALAEEGATVVALARDRGALDRLALEAEALAGTVEVLRADVRRSGDVARAVGRAAARWGRLDVVVNAAGVYAEGPIDAATDADYALTLDTNLRGAFNVCRAAVPVLREQRSGQIVSLASVAALRGWAQSALYCASKFGVLGLMDSLDEELRGSGIRVATICPGPTATAMTENWSLPASTRRQLLRAEDVARTVVWVVSQPPHVAVGLVVVRPAVALPYSGFVHIPSPRRRDVRQTGTDRAGADG
jgi:NADP-dependent 3-hydroxy acid dehydrogenase YdfG